MILEKKHFSDDWDDIGLGTKAVKMQTVEKAREFLSLLPENFTPEVWGLDYDGSVRIVWAVSAIWLQITFHPEGDISYLYMYGKTYVKTKLSFSTSLPELIKIIQKPLGLVKRG